MWVLPVNFGSYQFLPGSQAYENSNPGVYSSSGTTFIFIFMVNSASTSFPTRNHAPTHGKLTYRGGTGPPKKGLYLVCNTVMTTLVCSIKSLYYRPNTDHFFSKNRPNTDRFS